MDIKRRRKIWSLVALFFISFFATVTILAFTTIRSFAASTNITETVKFQAPSANKQYYLWIWDTNTKTDSTFVPLKKGTTNTYSVNIPKSTKKYSFIITTTNNWNTAEKVGSSKSTNATNGITVNTNGKAETAYVTSGGYEITEPTTNNNSLQQSAFATADEVQATATDDFTAFDKQWAYDGNDLGFTYSASSTTFKLWAPTATSVRLLTYGTNNNPNAALKAQYTMHKGTTASSNLNNNNVGVWSYTLGGNQNGLVYQYQVTFADGTVSDFVNTTGKKSYGTYTATAVTNKTGDPYAIAVTQGGLRSVVESSASLASNLAVKQGSAASWRVSSPTQAIIDEIHVGSFTKSATSGVSADKRGKYLGVIQANTKDPNTGSATGLSYLKSEGFNYVQLMPVSEFASINDSGTASASLPDTYNWGYDPENEMVPEGAYASNSINPTTRIKEMKEMVQGLHSNGIGVVMDVVLNHVYSQKDSAFEKSEPGYYFRDSTASGCGNDTASNHEMFRNYILKAVTYWAKNYDIDGFRFDEMSLIDKTTMNKLRSELSAIDPHILTYGEGWGNSTDLADSEKTAESSATQTAGIGFFDDAERDVIGQGSGSAYVDSNTSTDTMNRVAGALLASGGWNGNASLENFLTPSQAVNYVECHDGLNLNDELWKYNINDSQTTHNLRDELANVVNLFAQGVTFMENGQEFNQSKLVNPITGASVTAQQANANAWGSASWGLAANSYNGLAAYSNGTYLGGNVGLHQYATTYYDGYAANQINWDNVKKNQSAVNFISQVMKFKKSNPQFWPNSYSSFAWSPSSSGVMNVTNSKNGVVTLELTSGSTKYLVIFNANKSAVSIGKGSSYYKTTSLKGKTVTLSDDSTLQKQAGKALTTDSVKVNSLTATMLKLK